MNLMPPHNMMARKKHITAEFFVWYLSELDGGNDASGAYDVVVGAGATHNNSATMVSTGG
ncbi:hypothetical protein ColTof4_14464 [Colletotrichum tofieldiae]|nr:hypothetical protein ColTof3_14812 [Colletotrichum tofieldiae]GKT82041.1 hypothetical protein ColTof4_14464 [Colletotrichum tofieldiae]